MLFQPARVVKHGECKLIKKVVRRNEKAATADSVWHELLDKSLTTRTQKKILATHRAWDLLK